MRPLTLASLVTVAAVLAACGGDAAKEAPPGSPENPLVATPTQKASGGRSNEAAAGASESPGYRKLVERQGSRPRSRFTPCNLVTRAQARAILGVAMDQPLEAPQGPTCIYRSKRGNAFVTVAVQSADFAKLRRQIRRPQRVDVSGSAAYCGIHGQAVLYASLSGGRVLSIAAPCSVARRFALRALPRLGR